MTRINANISPKHLHRRHLIAEYREITMVPAALRRSLMTRTASAIRKGIPEKFTLNKGHVTFFFDKMEFLRKRFEALCDEIEARGYKCDRGRAVAFGGFDPEFNTDWLATARDNELVWERIELRMAQKPHLYT